ncbi:MAG: hypothetical protein U0V02_00820 [Anaerolineales bacterium]
MKSITLRIAIIVLLMGCVPTPIYSTTSYPPHQSGGPYLLFQSDPINNRLMIMNADGSEQKDVQVPNGAYYGRSLELSVSPDKKWIVYFSGSTDEPYDLSINLLNLFDGAIRKIATLLAPGFPENLQPVIDSKLFPESEMDCLTRLECQIYYDKYTLFHGIYTFAWSPNSKEIAFTAQIDGPSSDIYIYNLENQSIRRVTNEIEHIGATLEWSPDGKKILYSSAITTYSDLPEYIRTADPNNMSPQNSPIIDGGINWVGYDWITNDSYLIFNLGTGPANHFRYINAENQEVSEIWGEATEAYYIDLEHKRLFVSQYSIASDQKPGSALFEVSFEGTKKNLLDQIYYPLETPSFSHSFFATKNENLYLIGVDGEVKPLSREIRNSTPLVHVSPDKKWVIIVSNKGTELYSDKLKLIKSWENFSDYTIWRPDSKGVFLYSNPNIYSVPVLYYVPISDLSLVTICSGEDCTITDHTWLP